MSCADFAAALLEPERPCPAGLKTWNGSDPAARLAVYRNNVVASLSTALADTFPVTMQLVGAEFFRAMAGVFVRQQPPRSRILAHYGGEFPAFVEGFEPARTVPYLADVARLEWARVNAYHAADAAAVAADAVEAALANLDRAGELRLGCQPGVSALASPFAIVSLWAAHQEGGDITTVDPSLPESALVLRTGHDVVVMRLAPGASTFVAALQRSAPLAEAANQAVAEAADFDVTAALSLLVQHGALSDIHLPQRNPT